MQTMYKHVRARCIRALLVVCAVSGVLQACQSLPAQPEVADCQCPPVEQACPSENVESDGSTADQTPSASSDPSVAATSTTSSESASGQSDSEPPASTEPPAAKPPADKPSATAQSNSAKPGAATRPNPIRKPAPSSFEEKPIIGRVEYVSVESDNLRIKARIDTGAGLTSLHAQKLVNFERDGKPWVRFSLPKPDGKENQVYEKPVKRYIDIKQPDGDHQNRPVVEMTVELGPIREIIDVTLTDRNGYVYQMLIGRNFLMDRAIVDVSRKFSIKSI